MIKKILLIVLASSVCSLPLLAGILEERIEKELDWAGGKAIEIKTTNGFIEIQSWEQNKVRIEADIKIKSGSSKEAQELLQKIDIIADEQGDRLSIYADYPHKQGGGFFDWILGFSKPSVTVSFTVTIPGQSDLRAHSVNGAVKVRGVTGRVDLETTNGKLSAEGLTGMTTASTVNGSIKARINRFEDANTSRFKTTNGSIKLYIPTRSDLDVNLSTVNGKIHTDFALTVNGGYGGKKIRGKINNGGNAELTAKTVNGSIDLIKY